MARKSAALIPDAPVKLSKDTEKWLAQMAALPIPQGTEAEYARFMQASRDREEQWVRVDALATLVDKKGRDDPNWPAFQEAMRILDIKIGRCFGFCDQWMRARNKALLPPERPIVPEPEIRTIVIESISDKLDDLQFTINHGMLGSKIAQAIRSETFDESAGEPPYCQDCED